MIFVETAILEVPVASRSPITSSFEIIIAMYIFHVQFDQGILVSQNPAKEAAANGLLRKGDIVVGVNGE